MIRYPRQGYTIPSTYHTSIPKRKRRSRHDRLFHLPTTIAQNDPFLRRVYSVVSLVLDDHPYPATKEDYERRTYEIQENIRELNLLPVQLKFLRRLMDETGVTLVDLWQGSHIITLDNGYLYDLWSTSPSARPRPSSHYSEVSLQQYGIDFNDHQLLFGKTSINGSTWFQMEAHGYDPNGMYDDPDLFIYHGQDFIKYRFHNMNVGPFGFSPHTETLNPVIRPYRPIQLKQSRLQTRRQKRSQSERSFLSGFRK